MAPDQPETVSLYQQMDQESLSPDSRFTFLCQPDLPCFNQCCLTPTVILSPYDLLRLKQGLGITSTALLERYTRQEIEPNSNLPLVFIDAYRSPEGGCPFLGEHGCTVYPDRPAACRLFPLTMGSRLTPDGVEDHYFCRRLDYCRGFDAEPEWTVASWMADQGFTEYDQGRRDWLEILLKAGVTEEAGGRRPGARPLCHPGLRPGPVSAAGLRPGIYRGLRYQGRGYRRPQDGRPGPPQVQLPLAAHPPVAGGGAKAGRR